MWEYSLSVATSSFKMRFIFFPIQSRFRQLLWSQYELLLPSLASYYLHDRSLLMSRRNTIFFKPFFSYLFSSMGTCVRQRSLACTALHGSRRRFHVNMGFSDHDRILAVSSNICCNIATGTNFSNLGWLIIWYLDTSLVCVASFSLASCDVIT